MARWGHQWGLTVRQAATDRAVSRGSARSHRMWVRCCVPDSSAHRTPTVNVADVSMSAGSADPRHRDQRACDSSPAATGESACLSVTGREVRCMPGSGLGLTGSDPAALAERARSYPCRGHPASRSADVQPLDPIPWSRANSRSRMPGIRTAPLASTTPRTVSTAPVTRNIARQRVRAACANRIVLPARAGVSGPMSAGVSRSIPAPSFCRATRFWGTYSFPVCRITA